MKYAISDIHGCFDKYKKMLDIIDLKDEDTLYVLGDVTDRGEGGIDVLLDMMQRTNVVPILGNHDYMARMFLKNLDREASDKTLEMFLLWCADGGKATAGKFAELDEKTKKNVLSYWDTFQFYEKTTAGGKNFFLSHTLPKYEEGKSIFDCSIGEYIVGETSYDKIYMSDTYTVTGHVPTLYIDEKSKGKIWQGNRHIAIDCGAFFGSPLGCIRLEDFQEFYAE